MPNAAQATYPPPPRDPGLQPTPAARRAQQIKMILRLLTSGGGTDKDLEAKAGSSVHSILDPLIAQITQSFTGQTEAGLRAIQGLTSQYAGDIGKLAPEVGATYEGAKKDTATANAALTSYLTDAGDQAYKELSGKISAAGAPPAAYDPARAASADLGHGAGGEVLGKGTSSLDALSREGASAVSLMQELPGFALMQGAGTARQFGLSKQKELSDKLSEINAQAPGLIQSILGDLRNSRDTRRQSAANMVLQLLTSGDDRDLQKAIARQGYNVDLSKLASDNSQFNASELNDLEQQLLGTSDDTSTKHSQSYSQFSDAAYQAAASLIHTEKRTNARGVEENVTIVPKYGEAFQAVYQHIAGAARQAGLTEAEIKEIVNSQLAAIGITKPVTKPAAQPGPRPGGHKNERPG